MGGRAIFFSLGFAVLWFDFSVLIKVQKFRIKSFKFLIAE